jgi:cell division protein FtsB
MSDLLRRLAYVVILIVAGVYIVVAQRGPQGIPALLESRRQIRQLQEQNAELARRIAAEKEEVRKLRTSKSAQETEIRKEWNLQHKGDVTLMLPTPPAKSDPPAQP